MPAHILISQIHENKHKKSNSENEIQEIAQFEHTRNQVKTSTAANQTNAEMRTMNSNK